MILVSRGVSSVWWVSVSSRASGSALTVDRTRASGISWRLTRTVALAVHRLGRNMAIEAAAASTKRQGSSASRRRRRTTSSTVARPRPRADSSWRFAGVAMVVPRRSGNDDDIAGTERHVFLAAGADGAVVVEAQTLGLSTLVLAEDDDLARRREIAEAAGQGDGLEHRGGRLELQHARLLDLAQHRHAVAAHPEHRHRDLGVRHELGEGGGDLVAQLH